MTFLNIRIVQSTLFFLVILWPLQKEATAQDRAMYATVWSISSAKQIDEVIETAHKYQFNQIFFQARYRGDVLYTPNRIDSTYENKEHLSYVVRDSTFDPLGYAIKKAKKYNIEIHAWLTVFVITPHDLWKLTDDHIYYRNQNWVTHSRNGQMMPNNVLEGAFFDPGVPCAKRYFMNVASDIAVNYDIDGIQFDYIRYPDSSYGHNPIAKNEYAKSDQIPFQVWKQNQVSEFVESLYRQLKKLKSGIKVTAAVVANREKALNRYSQDWAKWLEGRYIDKVYLMAYNSSNRSYTTLMKNSEKLKHSKKIVMVLRAWPQAGRTYPASQINDKILISRQYHFKNLGFFSYSGMKDNNYFSKINFR